MEERKKQRNKERKKETQKERKRETDRQTGGSMDRKKDRQTETKQIFLACREVVSEESSTFLQRNMICKNFLFFWNFTKYFWDLVVTLNENHQIIHLLKIIEILNKFKIFKYHRIGNFSNIIDLRKLDFLSKEKISERFRFAIFT